MMTFSKTLVGRILCIAAAIVLLGGCLGVPDGITPVSNFDVDRYMGTWYEIARIENRFERGLENISANYTLLENGRVKVLNRGFNLADQAWEEANGKALFVGETDVGYLKVSFFGPIYGSYVVFELDHENYQHAFIANNDRTYLWFLSRTPSVDDDLMAHFMSLTKELGFDQDKFVFVDQTTVRE